MFGIVYCWDVKPGCEAEFTGAWCAMTDAIKDEMGGLGSRLHHAGGQVYFAYAQWPSRDAWQQLRHPSDHMLALRAVIRAISTDRLPHLHGEIVADLFVAPDHH